MWAKFSPEERSKILSERMKVRWSKVSKEDKKKVSERILGIRWKKNVIS